MAAGLVAQHQQTSFATPINGAAGDATVVLGNDNATVSSYNTHDSDGTIHLQSSTAATFAATPAGTAGRKWMTSDGLRLYYDTGSVWSEIAYAALAGTPVFTTLATFNAGATIASGQTLTVTGATITGLTAASVATGTFPGVYTVTGALTLSAALTYGGVTLSNAVTGTGNMVLSASPTFTGTITAATVTASGIGTFSNLVLSGTNGELRPGPTSFRITNNAVSANNLILNDNGDATARAGSTWAFASLTATGTTAVQALTATTYVGSGNMTVTGTTANVITLNGAAGSTAGLTMNAASTSREADIFFQQATVDRWQFGMASGSATPAFYFYSVGAAAQVLSFAYTTGAATFSAGISATTAAFTGNVTRTGTTNSTMTGFSQTNSDAGTAATTRYQAINDGGAYGALVMYSSGYTTSGINIASSTLVYANGAGGLSLSTGHASGVVRIYSGNETLALTISAAQAATFVAGISATTGTFSTSAKTTSGSTSVPNNTDTTIITVPGAGVYLINAYADDASAWSGGIVVSYDGTLANGIMTLGSSGTFTWSGFAGGSNTVKVKQTSGVTKTVTWQYLRIN